jgi:hypothetical protein
MGTPNKILLFWELSLLLTAAIPSQNYFQIYRKSNNIPDSKYRSLIATKQGVITITSYPGSIKAAMPEKELRTADCSNKFTFGSYRTDIEI